MKKRKKCAAKAKRERPRKEALVTPYLIEELRAVDPKKGKRVGRLFARALIKLAMKGSGTIAKEILERVEGKVKKEIEHSGPGGGPIRQENVVVVRVPGDD